MSTTKDYTVQVQELKCSFSTAWEYLTEPMNQKEWGIHFYKDIQKSEGNYLATLPFGTVPLSLQCDRESGSIDIQLGEAPPVPTRLIKLTEEVCLYVFVLSRPREMPEPAWFNQGVPNMEEELQVLAGILEKEGGA